MAPATRISALLFVALAILAAGCSDSQTNAPVSIDPNTVKVNNSLLVPVRVAVNGIDIGVVGAGTSRVVLRGELDTLNVRYVIAPTSDVPFGDTIVGHIVWRTSQLRASDTLQAMINADINGDALPDIFAPGLKNRTAVPVVVGINMETVFENRAGAIVQAGDTSAKFIGYFRLPRLSPDLANVRIYRTDKAFSATDFLTAQFGFNFDDTMVDPITGYTVLTISAPPPLAGRGPLPVGN